MDYSEKRITKLRDYLFNVIDELVTNNDEYQINSNMLSNDINNYSIDKIPTEAVVERWITGIEIHRDVYSFRSRMAYSQDVINNLSNIGFFEDFETKIFSNNKKGILPEIDGIQEIRCLNCGTMNFAETNTAEFDIQIQITYKYKTTNKTISL
jgi:hypothetical protein